MRHPLNVVAALAAIALAPVATLAAPDTAPQATPVQIDRCRLEYTPGGGGFGLLGVAGALTKSSGQLKIKFTNESDKPASIIRFAVDLDGKDASIRDVGTFAPGVTVDHGFKDFAGTTGWVFGRQAQPTCHVTYVKFADGSTWESATATAAAPAAASPNTTAADANASATAK